MKRPVLNAGLLCVTLFRTFLLQGRKIDTWVDMFLTISLSTNNKHNYNFREKKIFQFQIKLILAFYFLVRFLVFSDSCNVVSYFVMSFSQFSISSNVGRVNNEGLYW